MKTGESPYMPHYARQLLCMGLDLLLHQASGSEFHAARVWQCAMLASDLGYPVGVKRSHREVPDGASYVIIGLPTGNIAFPLPDVGTEVDLPMGSEHDASVRAYLAANVGGTGVAQGGHVRRGPYDANPEDWSDHPSHPDNSDSNGR